MTSFSAETHTRLSIIGLQLLGCSGWVRDAFHGAGPVAAVTVAHLVRVA